MARKRRSKPASVKPSGRSISRATAKSVQAPTAADDVMTGVEQVQEAARAYNRFDAVSEEGSIVLFGAYANGNIGDMYQANAVAHHFAKHAPSLKVFATSNSSAARPYEFDFNHQVGPASAITDAEIINQYRALVIGGGGLLASVHRPMNSENWVNQINIPIVLFAVGANEEIAEKCKALIERADIVTARDSYSLEVLSKYRPDVTMLNDPILADERLDASEKTYNEPVHRICVIPRKQTAKNQPVYEALAEQMKSRDRVVSMFPATDRHSGALTNFAKFKPIETWKMGELVAAIDASSNVVSERYHGCIVALKRLVPTLGLINSEDERRSKIGEFYLQAGHPHLLLNYRQTPLSRADIVAKLQGEFDAAVFRASLKKIQDEFNESFKRLLNKMGIDGAN